MKELSLTAVDAGDDAPQELPPVSDERLAPLVRDARRGLIRALQAALSQHSVAAGHWTFLRILWIRDGINQRKLSDLAGVMEPTTFAALQAMERLGYISRQRRPDNRKNIYVYLTAEGRALQAKLMPIALAINARASNGVSEEDLAATLRTLHKMIANLAEERAESQCARRSRRSGASQTTPLRRPATLTQLEKSR